MQSERNNIRIIEIIQSVSGIILFILPFFWFANGVVDLGGDSSRVYYIEPLEYLKNFSMSAILNIGHIIDFPGYYGVSFTLFLVLLSRVFNASNINAILTGLSLSAGFFFTSFVTREFLRIAVKKDDVYIRLSAFCAGILYVFIPYQTKSWTTPLMTQFAFFLNPAFLYYALRYLVTGNLIYILFFSILSFVFSQNFSFAGAPFLFSFYPITFLYLIFFSKQHFPKSRISGALIFVILLLFLHGYHWFSLIQNLFSKNSALNTMVFDLENIKDRGLSYFFASASSTYLPHSLLGATQFAPIPFITISFGIFPLIIMAAGYYVWKLENSRALQKFYTSLVILFTILLFLVSGHILIGFKELYSYLFYIPGFSMFRAFYDKWAYPYYLYYSIFIGVSYYILLNISGKITKRILLTFLFIPFFTSISFLRGSTVITQMFGSKTFHSGILIESDFKHSLDYIRTITTDDRWLNLPFADWEYQVVRDSKKGIYIAPSIISLLGGKTDYVGLVQFEPYKRILISSLKSGYYQSLNKLLEMLSIRYVFFNKDQSILSSYDGNFPYNEIGSLIPQQIIQYEKILNNIHASELTHFGTYSIGRLTNNAYPRVYIPDCVIRTDSKEIIPYFETPLCTSAKRATVLNSTEPSLPSNFDMHLHSPEDPYRLTAKNVINANIQYSFAKYAPNSFAYPFIRIKEDFDIWLLSLLGRKKEIRTKQFAFAAKRIYELDRWRSYIPPVSKKKCTFPEIYCKYTGISWLDLLDTYRRLLEQNMSLVESVGISRDEAKSELSAYIIRDHDRIKNFILTSSLDDPTQKRLFSYSDSVFNSFRDYQLKSAESPDIVLRYDRLNFQQKIHTQYFVEQIDGYKEWKPIEYSQVRGLSEYVLPELTSNLLQPIPNEQPIASISGHGKIIQKQTPQNTLTWLVMDGIQPEQYYRLMLSYKTEGQAYDITVSHYNPLLPESSRRNTIFRQALFSMTDADYELLFRTDKNTSGIEIRINPSDLGKAGRLEISTIKLIKLPLPKVLEIAESNMKMSPPDIQYRRINPTKYEVDITNAVQPFYLVLNDSYSDHWSVYIKKHPETHMMKMFSQKFQRIYDFLDSNPLEFIYNSPISAPHIKVNYFANGWLIDPRTLQGDSSTIIIEHRVQGYFYVAFVLSIIVFGALIIVLITYGFVRIYRIIKHE